MDFFDQLNAEISRMTIENFIALFLMFYIPFHFSRKAQSLFFHLLYSITAFYMIFFTQDTRIINDPKLLIGLGLLIPQIRFIIQFTKDSIFTIKMMSSNTYYFFLTIYYKIQRFISWIQDVILMFKNFDFKTNDSYKEEKTDNNSYEEQTHQKEEYNSYQENTKYEESKKEHGEYERFYSSNNYVVLGVSPNDDFKTIKETYRTLIKEYHTDRIMMTEPEKFKLYTEICQNINNAYDKLQKIHN